jgi:hypothetical protein
MPWYDNPYTVYFIFCLMFSSTFCCVLPADNIYFAPFFPSDRSVSSGFQVFLLGCEICCFVPSLLQPTSTTREIIRFVSLLPLFCRTEIVDCAYLNGFSD